MPSNRYFGLPDYSIKFPIFALFWGLLTLLTMLTAMLLHSLTNLSYVLEFIRPPKQFNFD
jgi:hypothetical protein